jgi:hypothetical protein
MKPTKRSPGAAKTIDGYVAAAPAPSQERLRRLVAVVRAAAPDATERIAYGLPTWHQGENLIHLGGGSRRTLPGSAALRRSLVNAHTTTVEIRDRLRTSSCTTT